MRVILGVVEAGLFPGLNVYLTFFYTKQELALRVGYLFVSAAIAGALGGLLAYGIGQMDGISGYKGWRWIFIIEGLPSIVLGVVAFFFLPNDIDHAYFLTPEEKKLANERHFRHYGFTESAQKFSKKDMLAAFKDWKVWMFCLAQFGVDTLLYGKLCGLKTYNIYKSNTHIFNLGYSTFLPTIIRGLGQWSAAEIQLLTIPCYFVGAVTYMGIAFLSDRMQMRGLFTVAFGAVSVVGYGVLLSNSSAGVHYFGYDWLSSRLRDITNNLQVAS